MFLSLPTTAFCEDLWAHCATKKPTRKQVTTMLIRGVRRVISLTARGQKRLRSMSTKMREMTIWAVEKAMPAELTGKAVPMNILAMWGQKAMAASVVADCEEGEEVCGAC